MIFWLGGWACGVVFVVLTLWRIFRKTVPARLLLNKPLLAYDGGVGPFKNISEDSGMRAHWSSLFPTRQKLEFSKNEIESLQLRETPDGNRLTIDKGATRIELAGSTSEVEREWLFEYLQKNYSLQ